MAENIITFPSEIDLLLIGGKIAGDTFYAALAAKADALFEKLKGARVLHTPHPAWRMWSKTMEKAVAGFIARGADERFAGREEMTSACVSTNGTAHVTFKRAPHEAPFEVWIMKTEAA